MSLSFEPSQDPPARVSKIAFHEVRTEDVSRLAEYYEAALHFAPVERAEDCAFLTLGADHHTVVIRKGAPDGRARIGFEISGSLDDTATRLETAGVPAERRSDPEPGITDALVLAEAGSGVPLVLFERQATSDEHTRLGLRPTKLGHIASYVTDLQESQAFYLDVLGFRWSDLIGDFFTFLRCNRDHHAINLMQSTQQHGLFHVAYEMRDLMHMHEQLDHLSTLGYYNEWGPGRHGAGHNIFAYHRDPDGNITELFTELDIIANEQTGHFEPRPWHESWPQGPKVWGVDVTAANKWGPINPDFLMH